MNLKDELSDTMEIAQSLRETIRELLEQTERQNAFMRNTHLGHPPSEPGETIEPSGQPEG
jgi:hypothetical protein